MLRPPLEPEQRKPSDICHCKRGWFNTEGIRFLSIIFSASLSRLSEFGVVLAIKVILCCSPFVNDLYTF